MNPTKCFAVLLIAFTCTALSQPVTNDTLTISQPGVLNVLGQSGRPYILELTPQLSGTVSWSPLTNFVMSATNSFGVTDSSSAAASQRFYRLRRDTVLADSAADFSGVQGSNNWSYGYYVTPFKYTNFVLLDQYTAPGTGSLPGSDGGWTPSTLDVWTRIFQYGGSPNGTSTSGGRLKVDHYAVRRWQSTVSRTVTIALYLADLSTGGGNGNGIVARVIVDGTVLLNYTLAEGVQSFQTLTANVQGGSLVDFVIDPRNSNDLTDRAEYLVLIY